MVHRLPNISDLHLVSAKSSGPRLGDFGGEGVEPISMPIVAGRGVGRERTAESAQQPPKRLARAFAKYVPERDVDTRQGSHDQPATAMVIGFLKHLFPEILRLARVLADDERQYFSLDEGGRHDMGPAPHRG